MEEKIEYQGSPDLNQILTINQKINKQNKLMNSMAALVIAIRGNIDDKTRIALEKRLAMVGKEYCEVTQGEEGKDV